MQFPKKLKKTGQTTKQKNRTGTLQIDFDSTMFNEAEFTQYFDYPTKFKKIDLFNQKK